MHKQFQRLLTVVTSAGLVLGSMGDAWAAKAPNAADSYPTLTPIKHVVVIFQENVSFDHYFGTYPFANNPANEPARGWCQTSTGFDPLCASKTGHIRCGPGVGSRRREAVGVLY